MTVSSSYMLLATFRYFLFSDMYLDGTLRSFTSALVAYFIIIWAFIWWHSCKNSQQCSKITILHAIRTFMSHKHPPRLWKHFGSCFLQAVSVGQEPDVFQTCHVEDACMHTRIYVVSRCMHTSDFIARKHHSRLPRYVCFNWMEQHRSHNGTRSIQRLTYLWDANTGSPYNILLAPA